MARMFFEVGPFNCLVSSHGYFAVSSEAGQRLFDANVGELGHGIRYRYDDLGRYSSEECDHATTLDWTTMDPIPYLSWLLGGGGDEISPRLGDRLIEDALQEWVERHQFALSRRSGDHNRNPALSEKVAPSLELLMPDPPPHPALSIRPISGIEADLSLQHPRGLLPRSCSADEPGVRDGDVR